VLDQLPVDDADDVDLLNRPLAPTRREPLILADVPPAHAGADRDPPILAEHVAVLDAKSCECLVEPEDRLLHRGRAAAAAGRDLVAEEIGVNELVNDVEVGAVRDLVDETKD
jgi:hypothetical protein